MESTLWRFYKKNYGAPKSFILLGCSIINHPFGGTPWYPHKLEPPPSFPLSRSIDATTWKHSTWQLSPAGHGHGSVQPFAEARLSATKADEETHHLAGFKRKKFWWIIPGDDWSRKKTSYGLNTRDDGLTCFSSSVEMFFMLRSSHLGWWSMIPNDLRMTTSDHITSDHIFSYFFRAGTTK